MKKYRSKKTGLLKVLIIILAILLVITGIYLLYSWFMDAYKVETVVVEGNVHMSDEEIEEIVMEGKYGDNSFYLSHKYKEKEIENIPFVQTINVSVTDRKSIRITVYEKALAGYVEYLGRFVYFDKDGYVVESSDQRTEGVPEIVGMNFDYVVLHEKLPVEDDELFLRVLNLTKLMNKYGVEAGKLYFNEFKNISLFIDDIRIELGTDENIDIKIMNLPSILLNLEGKRGTLHMEKYDEGTKRVSFENE